MKKILLILIGLLIPVSVFAYVSPGKASGFVNDFAGVFTLQEKRDIEGKLVTLQRETGVEVVVATVSSLGGDTVEQYAVKLFEEWKIGDAQKDTGLLVLVAPTERQVKIETGYGTEGFVTDIQSANIIRSIMLPAFKEGRYAVGVSGAVDALSSIIRKSPEAAEYSLVNDSKRGSTSSSGAGFGWIFFLVIIVLNVLSQLLGKTKSWWLGGVIGAFVGGIIGLIWGFFNAGIIAIPILVVLGLLFDFIVSKHPPRSGGGHSGFWPIFFGGGGFGGGSSGGFGGFGGGSSGGGGASGRW
jgi:uncharacterized protein